jgi:hypothetical protein
MAPDAVGALRADGLEAQTLRTAPTYAELRVTDGADTCIVDLVAEPFGPLAPPDSVQIENVAIAVDSRREILASKLATLLERSEPRDLVDVKALLDAGADLEDGLRDAPQKDAGFSPLTLAWVLRDYDPRPAVKALGWSDVRAEELLRFRQWLIDRLTASAAPE